jgi:hypothetical protein
LVPDSRKASVPEYILQVLGRGKQMSFCPKK